MIFLTLINLALSAQMNLVEGKASFNIEYTFGTHKGKTQKLTGKLDLNTGRGSIITELANLKTDNDEMTCHMHESIGLDYEQSEFPKKHICSKQNEIPKEGENSIAYPDISFYIEQAKILDESEQFLKMEVSGFWSMHGKRKNEGYTLTLSKRGEYWINTLKTSLKLSDFDIVVKKFLFIGVDDQVNIEVKTSWKKSG